METEKTKEEAARMLGKYLGQRADFVYKQFYTSGVFTIGGEQIGDVDFDNVISFQILLRGIDEMTEEEKGIGYEIYEKLNNSSGYEWELLAAQSIDYLRSIGVATSEEDRQLITIKN